MSSQMLSVLACLSLCAGCGTQTVVRPVMVPAPPAWVMQPCEPWQVLAGSGRVQLADLAEGIAVAKAGQAECSARLEGLQGYVREVVRPGARSE